MTVEIGDAAPDFRLMNEHRSPVQLSDFRGEKAVVLVFYPITFTRTCGAELCAIRDDLSTFQNEQVQVLAVSVDSTASQRLWAEQEGFGFPVLSDFWPHGEVARRYGVFDEQSGLAERGTFVIDKSGVVRYKVVKPISEARDHDAVAKAIADL